MRRSSIRGLRSVGDLSDLASLFHCCQLFLCTRVAPSTVLFSESSESDLPYLRWRIFDLFDLLLSSRVLFVKNISHVYSKRRKLCLHRSLSISNYQVLTFIAVFLSNLKSYAAFELVECDPIFVRNWPPSKAIENSILVQQQEKTNYECLFLVELPTVFKIQSKVPSHFLSNLQNAVAWSRGNAEIDFSTHISAKAVCEGM